MRVSYEKIIENRIVREIVNPYRQFEKGLLTPVLHSDHFGSEKQKQIFNKQRNKKK